MNDILSLDDANLRRAKVPYTSKQAISFLQTMRDLAQEKEQATTPVAYSVAQDQQQKIATHTPNELGNMLSLFLGNPQADENTLWRTLEQLEQHGLLTYQRAVISATTRIFDHAGHPMGNVPADEILSFRRDEIVPYDPVLPSFHYPSAFRAALGTPPEIHEFLSFVADTLLSDAHRQNKDWVWFFATKARDTILAPTLLAPALLAQKALLAQEALPSALVATLPPHVLTDLSAFADWASAPPLAERDRANTSIEHFLRHIFAQNWAVTHPIHLYLGLPWQASPGLNISSYALLHAAYRLGESSEDLLFTPRIAIAAAASVVR
jgi:hypothetical protein